jgi:hypothetical protein
MNVVKQAGWLLAIGVSVSLAASAAAQTATPSKPASDKAAKTAKTAKKTAGPGFRLIVEPRAMELLKATSEKLAGAKTMSFTAVVGYEYPSKLGPPIVYTTRYDVSMMRPDRLRILMPGDGPASEFYYDGKAMIAYAPAENLAAFADAPPTIDAALAAAYKNAAIFFPFTDLLIADPYRAFADGVILAFYIGPSGVIAGTKTEMIGWANNDVFLQIWIGADDKLPRRVRAQFRADKLGLRHEMELSNWQLDPVLPADTFATAKAEAAGRMSFAAPAPPPKGVKGIVKGTNAMPARAGSAPSNAAMPRNAPPANPAPANAAPKSN